MEKVQQYFISRGAAHLVDRIHVFTESSATVELAAQCLNCEPAHIAKSLSFLVKVPKTKADNKKAQKASSPDGSPTSPAGGDDGSYPIIIVAAGDAKVNAKKYKAKYNCSPKMFKREEVEEAVGYPAGGVCPFGVNPNVRVYLDVSLKRFEKVHPACGTANTGIPLSCSEMEQYADNFVEWVDVCEGWQEAAGSSGDTPKAEGDPKKAENETAKKAEEV